MAMQKEAYNPTIGSTPAMMEKAIASGIKARATTIPESTSPRTLQNHSCFNVDIFKMTLPFSLYKYGLAIVTY